MLQSARPLEGITVVSLEHAIAAPFCTRQLTDMGARVIKVERPGVGDFARGYDERVNGLSSHFVWTNRSKESLTLNLKDEEGKSIIDKLLSDADVLVQNLALGAAVGLSLSAAVLHKKHPRLIVCDISGYGENGPYRDKKAYDLLIQSEAGFLSVTRTAEEQAKAGCSIADIAAGMYAYSHILAALIKRGRDGMGSHIGLSMLESLTEWMSFPLYYVYQGASAPVRSGAEHATIYPYGPFKAGDGKVVMLGLQNEREWKVFCEQVLQNQELAQDARFSSNLRRHENRSALRTLILDRFASLTADEVVSRLDQAQIANAHVNTMQDLWQPPQLAARGRWSEIDSPAGRLPALLPPGVNNTFAFRMDAVPALGQHTDAILGQLGYAQSQIDDMRGRGAI